MCKVLETFVLAPLWPLKEPLVPYTLTICYLKEQFIQKLKWSHYLLTLISLQTSIVFFFSCNTKQEFIVHYLNSKLIRIVLLNWVCSTNYLIWFTNMTERFAQKFYWFTHESVYRFSLIHSSQKELKTMFFLFVLFLHQAEFKLADNGIIL